MKTAKMAAAAAAGCGNSETRNMIQSIEKLSRLCESWYSHETGCYESCECMEKWDNLHCNKKRYYHVVEDGQ